MDTREHSYYNTNVYATYLMHLYRCKHCFLKYLISCSKIFSSSFACVYLFFKLLFTSSYIIIFNNEISAILFLEFIFRDCALFLSNL